MGAASGAAAAPAHHRRPGDGWVTCRCGERHWGLHGAAGLLLIRTVPDGEAHVALQHRAPWTHQGGLWGIPGGAREPGESAEEAALREAVEEAGVDPSEAELGRSWVLDHGDWTYTTVLSRLRPGAVGAISATDAESLEVAWVPVADVGGMELLPAFAELWRSSLACEIAKLSQP